MTAMVDLAAERTLVLTLVATPAAFDYCGAELDERMFADEHAGRIYEAVACLVLEGRPVTPVSVQAQLVKNGHGGSVVPSWAKGKTVDPADVQPLAQRIRELWCRRQLAALASRLEGAAEKGSDEAMKAIAEVQAMIQAGGTGSARSMLDLTRAYMDELAGDAADPGSRVAFTSGYPRYDRITGGLRPGILHILAARPGNGKTAFVMGMMAHLAHTGIPVGAFWLEDDWRDAVRRYHQNRNRLTAEQFRGPPERVLREMDGAATWGAAEQARIFIDDAHGLTDKDIVARMRRLNRERGVRVFFADHLGEMKIEKDDRWGDRRDLALGHAARAFRDTGKELKAATILVSQMNRRIEHRGQDARPLMSDLDGSGQVEQAARIISFLSQPQDENGEPTGEFTIDVEKNTNGPKGRVRMTWVPERMVVEDRG